MSTDMFGLGDLSAEEKLRIVTALWDDIANSSAPLVVPNDIFDEACRRNEELAQDPSIAIDEAELWRRVDG
jgi:hypothetical protein